MSGTDLLELKTYKQPGGVVITLRRLRLGYERLVNGKPQEWGTTWDSDESKSMMWDWQKFEERIGSEVL